MKINCCSANQVNFDTLQLGDVFEYNGNFFIRTHITGSQDNAINLRTFRSAIFNAYSKVIVHKESELIIK